MNATSQPSPITSMILLKVFWRSFFLQAANNYERMQNLGFAYCMAPALQRLFGGDDLAAAMKRHLEFFNSHPYLSSALLGASIRLEEDVSRGHKSPDDVRAFKRMMMGPMAAIGDSFFWSSLRPFIALWTIMGILSGLWWAPIGFIVVFNICHLSIRWYGIWHGYHRGHAVCERIHRLGLVRLAERTQYLAGIFIGAVAAIFADQAAHSPASLTDGLEPFLFLALILIFLLGLKRGFSMVGLLYGAMIASLVLITLLDAFFPLV
ncbi:MAG: PTS system mannose/fructose/sorbose family transporter subunit IID [Myxococcota bacterium]|nr:PTS system mannose/fructose/sorbose family transporter subunit IID [Myxococcota bacterium]